MPALAITRVQLELVSLGKQVQNLVERSAALVVESSAPAPGALTDEDKAADTLSTAILTYVGRLSDAIHTDDEGSQLVDLARIATCLDAIREVATTSMLALSQRRLAQGADMAQFRSSETSRFVTAVNEHFALAMKAIAHPEVDLLTRILDAKPEIEVRADTARQHIMSNLQLTARRTRSISVWRTAAGAAVLTKRLKRSQVLEYFANLSPCLIAIEACAGSHYWARRLAS
jgi:phosphate:Na+ symporter